MLSAPRLTRNRPGLNLFGEYWKQSVQSAKAYEQWEVIVDVKEFIAETLLQVTDGIAEAHEKAESRHFGTGSHSMIANPIAGFMQDHNGHLYTAVEFDLAVTVATEVGGKGGLKIPYFEASSGASRASEAVSRVRFSIPYRFGTP